MRCCIMHFEIPTVVEKTSKSRSPILKKMRQFGRIFMKERRGFLIRVQVTLEYKRIFFSYAI